jgi:ABC-type transport system substrate-binding protein
LACDSNWNESKPQHERAIFRIIADESTTEASVGSGELDLMRAEPDRLNQLSMAQFATLDVRTSPSLTISYLVASANQGRLRDERVRIAIQLAIDPDVIIGAGYGKFATRAPGFVPFPLVGARKQNQRPRRDLGRTRQLLKEAGGGFETEMFISDESIGMKIIAETFRTQLAEIGLGVKLQFENPFAAFPAKKPVPLSGPQATMRCARIGDVGRT